MILSNVEILRGISDGLFSIENLKASDPNSAPFNTSAVDLHLANEITIPNSGVAASIDLTKGSIAQFWAAHSTSAILTSEQPYKLIHGKFILANTIEKVNFPLLKESKFCYSARVEGKSSLARCGILIHFTAPTIHAGFNGRITLEIINLGPIEFLLSPGMPICQLIIEEVKGCPADAPNQFSGQTKPVGVV